MGPQRPAGYLPLESLRGPARGQAPFPTLPWGQLILLESPPESSLKSRNTHGAALWLATFMLLPDLTGTVSFLGAGATWCFHSKNDSAGLGRCSKLQKS